MTVSALKKKLVSQAIQVLRDLNKQYYEDSSKKKPLLEDEGRSSVFLQVMLKKIPKTRLIKMIKVNLPHALIKDTDEVCLITGDLDKMDRKAEIEPDILHYKSLLDKHGVTHVSEVMTLRQLRTEYKPYEAKQKLLAAYDIFLVDNKITDCLPRVLGKHFFKKRKFPIQINLKATNLKQQIEKALSTKVFYMTGHGNCCASEVAYLGMADSEILDNVMAMVETLYEKIPKRWDNVMGIYLKTARSKAIPLYMSYDDDKTDINEKKNLKGAIAEKSVLDAPDNWSITVQRKRKVENAVGDAPTESAENAGITDITDKKKLKRVMAGRNIPEAMDNNSITIKGKGKKGKIKNVEYTPTVLAENAGKTDITDKKKLKRVMAGENIPEALDNNSVTIKGKGKKGKIRNAEYTLTEFAENESSEGIKKFAFKRKRSLNESVIIHSEESVDNKETPMQATKKRKIEGINMRRYLSKKETRRDNKKKSQQRVKKK